MFFLIRCIHYIQKCCRHLSPSQTKQVFFDSGAGWFGYSWIREGCPVMYVCWPFRHGGMLLAQDVQVNWRGFSHGKQDLLNVLNVQPLLRFPLPAAQHDVVHLLRTDPWPLQHPALGYALNDLQRKRSDNVRRPFPFDWCLNGKVETEQIGL